MESKSKYRMHVRGPISKYLLFQKEQRNEEKEIIKEVIQQCIFQELKNKCFQNKKAY